jgi:hypothetical protein
LLALFAVLLIYHLNCMRQDSARAGQTLEERQRGFPVLLVDAGDEAFVNEVKAAMGKYAPEVPLVVQSIEEGIKTGDTKAVILPASLALDPPVALRKWLKAFSGEKIIVGEAGSGWVLSALTPAQAAQSARQAAEGEEVRLARPSPAWEVVKTVAVVLLGIELLFMLFGLGMSLVIG